MASRSFPPSPERTQARLLVLAAVFLFIYSLALSLAPAARAGSWAVTYNWRHWAGFLIWLATAFFAHRQMGKLLPNRDPYIFPAAALLSGWGALTIWRLYPSFGLRQSLWMLVVMAIFMFGLRLPPDLGFLRRYKYVWLTGGLILTGLTLLFGANPTGASFPRLWLGCCGVYFQPSEPLKLLLIVYLASYLAGGKHQENQPGLAASPRLLPALAPTLLMTGLALLLLLAQRDLGTVSIFLFLYAAIVYVTSGQKRILLVGGLAVLLSGAAGYFLFDVVRLRIDAWLNPWLDPSGRSYQIVQSLIAISDGGVFGRGPGLGSPGLVPVPHSDFIFTAIAEESGLLGSLALILLLALLAGRGLRIALAAQDTFRRYLAAGLTTFLAAQSVLIIGGNLRLLPLTGVTLPFVSYGGSSLLTSFLTLLILLQISNQPEAEPAPLAEPRAYLQVEALLQVGLAACALAAGWWALIRQPDLVIRTDNPRRVITDRLVSRGAILDRSSQPLVETGGQKGTFSRRWLYPPLSPVLGYTNPTYGQSGLEASLDGYLRGSQGNPGVLIWWNELLYGQPPPGLNVRLSVDANLQSLSDQALEDHHGALVLLNAQDGEILAIASHPYYDANRIEQDWERLVKDPQAPLLNRATLGRYPLGALGPLLFPNGAGSKTLNPQPQVYLPMGAAPGPGESPLLLSPLQVALAAAVLSGQGVRPAPELVLAVQTPQAGWVILPPQEQPVQALSSSQAEAAAQGLAVENATFWQTETSELNGPGKSIAWSVGGTLPDWKGASLAIAVLLEENDPTRAGEIARQVLQAAMQP